MTSLKIALLGKCLSSIRGGTPLCRLYRTCGPKEFGFSSISVINRASILASLVISRVWFLQSSLELDMFFRRSFFVIFIDKAINKSPS